ncbi:MAG: hypothetical protein MJE77_19695 [Proteobacteria bacterium]|nr:hypothetical protein [Pseudomonadota bacterium]
MVETHSVILACLAGTDIAISADVRHVLLGLLTLFLVIMACLVACVVILRQRQSAGQTGRTGQPIAPRRNNTATTSVPGRPGRGDTGAADRMVGVSAVSSGERTKTLVADPMACPACRREFDVGLQFCPYDATRLVPAAQMLDHLRERRQSGRVCPNCHRAFENSVSYCPHDGSDLVPLALHDTACDHIHDTDRMARRPAASLREGSASHSPPGRPAGAAAEDSVAEAKICPRCRGRYEYTALFCGRDGAELVVLN